jgi:hypothetical protein
LSKPECRNCEYGKDKWNLDSILEAERTYTCKIDGFDKSAIYGCSNHSDLRTTPRQEIDLDKYTGKIFKHFKGDLYLLIGKAEHSETSEYTIIYKALYGECKLYARPISSFLALIDKEIYPNATQTWRFELVNILSEK